MKKNYYSFLLMLAALIWGTSFVSQSVGGDLLGPYAFNFIRSMLSFLVLLPFALFLRNHSHTSKTAHTDPACTRSSGKTTLASSASPLPGILNRSPLLFGALMSGGLLGLSTNLQQIALKNGVSVGKTGFLTSCYIILVPILGTFLHRKCPSRVWISMVITVFGLYLLCINGSFSIEPMDILLLLCAFFFAWQILAVDFFAPHVNSIALSCAQFLVCSIISLFMMLCFEFDYTTAGVISFTEALLNPFALVSILYAGILSNGIADTLQIIGQKHVKPAIASLLMSLESVFSVLAGWILLGQQLSPREIEGCALIFSAVIIAQLPGRPRNRS